jgi:OOP family OmpA-OmpF porin
MRSSKTCAVALAAFLLPALASALVGCVSGAKIRADAEVVKRDIKKAREWRAYDCAPRDLALAETNVEFTESELNQGNWLRASEHIDVAVAAIKRALENSRECKPKKVLIREPPKVTVIKKTDRDGDGIFDVDDKCPDVPGLPEFQGCPPPSPKDRDGDGIFDDQDKCPDDPEDMDEFEDEDGCPDFDNDQDGIPDHPEKADKCPMIPEDMDNFEDEDGCPDPDNDKDGIIDHPEKKDTCPDDAEDKDGFEDEDGCPDPDNDKDGVIDHPTPDDKCPNEAGPPDSPQGKGCPRKYKLVKINRETKRIEIKQKVHFQTAKYRILVKSFKLLTDVGQALKDFPKMKVSIEGHTDSRGGDRYNQRLSENRANSVREYLIGKGIDSERLQSVGYGETKPIASNRTARGREANRRVEFRIVDDE